jgi:hypothetical protein
VLAQIEHGAAVDLVAAEVAAPLVSGIGSTSR